MGFERRIARRDLLRLGGGIAIGATISVLFSTPRVIGATPYALRTAWEQRDVPLSVTPLVSPPLSCDFVFNAVESRWDAEVPQGASLDFAVRTRIDGAQWTEWMHVHADTHARDGATQPTFGDLLLIPSASQAQYRLTATPDAGGVFPTLRAFAVTAVSTLPSDAPALVTAAAFNGSNIIPRVGWGADDKLRYDKDNKEIWTPEYRPIKKVVVHHTVTRDPETDAKATLRAIYQYHAVSRGWGDIGYNYLIDQQGNVYEGRYGGPSVVGGHTLGYNYGSLGIAMLGNYTDHTINDAARTALIALIKAKAGDLDPVGKSFFIDRDNVPNINGHRGMTNTSCPGDGFYPHLNDLRRELKGLPKWTGDPAADPIAANPPDVIVNAGAAATQDGHADHAKAVILDTIWPTTNIFTRDLVTVKFVVKNVGSTPFQSQDPPPTYVYTEGESYTGKGWPTVKGTLRIGVGTETTASDPMYRWGIGRTLQPGETITVPVQIRLTTPQRTKFVTSLIYEGYGLFDQDDPVQVTVAANPAEPAQPDKDTSTQYFAETKHNMAAEFVDYWKNGGGLAQFGFPLTEPFADINPDDGKAYKVQYFERARLEHHPDSKPPNTVQIGRLGIMIAGGRLGDKPFAKITAPGDSGDRRFFPEVGHTLGGAFKQYWDARGGLPIFGFPISEEFEEKSAVDGKTYIVQYFERNRFEYHPESKGTPQEVQLGLLGSEVIRRRGWIP